MSLLIASQLNHHFPEVTRRAWLTTFFYNILRFLEPCLDHTKIRMTQWPKRPVLGIVCTENVCLIASLHKKRVWDNNAYRVWSIIDKLCQAGIGCIPAEPLNVYGGTVSMRRIIYHHYLTWCDWNTVASALLCVKIIISYCLAIFDKRRTFKSFAKRLKSLMILARRLINEAVSQKQNFYPTVCALIVQLIYYWFSLICVNSIHNLRVSKVQWS